MSEKENETDKIIRQIINLEPPINFETEANRHIERLLKEISNSLPGKEAEDSLLNIIYKQFYLKYNESLASYIFNMVNFTEVANDILQETWFVLFEQWKTEKLIKIDNIYAYTVGISKNIFKKYLRNRDHYHFEKHRDNIIVHLRKSDLGGIERLIDEEFIFKISDYISNLNPPLPEIFNMYFMEGHNSRVIGKSLGIPDSTVRTYIRRIRRMIFSKFKNY